MTITAVEMAKEEGVDPKRFRSALRKEQAGGDKDLAFHQHGASWTVKKYSNEYYAMLRVLSRM